MKINKILAAGIAATLAVTSLSAVASAETVTKEFDMANTIGTIECKGSLGGKELSLIAQADASGALVQNAELAAGTGTPAAEDTYILDDTNFGGAAGSNGIVKVASVKLNVTGIKGQKNSTSKTYTYDFANYSDAACTNQVYDGSGHYWKLTSYPANGAPLNGLDISQFVEVTSISVDITTKNTGLGKTRYNNWKNYDWTQGINTIKYFSDGTATANGVEKAINATWFAGSSLEISNQSTKDLFAFLEKTTDDTTIDRSKVKVLSNAAAYRAQTLYTGGAQQEYDPSTTQSYKDSDGTGTSPFWFGGLASQCADFFNKQTNGKITFQFTDKAKDASGWKEGGIASTEVGLKNALADTNMGLFVNYESSTGSLLSLGQVDSEALTITFDISDILNDMGGLTKGNINDIYYGMNKGLAYKSDDYTSIHANVWYGSDDKNHAVGYITEKVILSYEDGADVDAAEEEVVDEPEDVEEPEDIEEPEEEPEEEEEPEFTIEPEEEEPENNGDVDIIEPTNNAKADDDANPGTGVALAVIPAIVAAAAVVVSKKRK